jgi:hypothetical protein
VTVRVVDRAGDTPDIQPHIQRTIFADPQLELWQLSDQQWRKLLERPMRQRRSKSAGANEGKQLSFLLAGLLVLVVALLQDHQAVVRHHATGPLR